MALTINTKTFTADSYNANSVSYIGPAKTTSVKDNLYLGRQAPKASSVYSGNGRTQAKLTRTFTLTGALTPSGEAICDIQVQVPVGYSATDVDALLNDMGAYLASADFKTLVKTQKISY